MILFLLLGRRSWEAKNATYKTVVQLGNTRALLAKTLSKHASATFLWYSIVSFIRAHMTKVSLFLRRIHAWLESLTHETYIYGQGFGPWLGDLKREFPLAVPQ